MIKRLYYLKIVLFFLLLTSLGSLGASGDITFEAIEEITKQTVRSEFDWYEDELTPFVEILDFTIDDDTFVGKTMLSVDVLLTKKENKLQRTVALLIEQEGSWKQLYTERLRTLLWDNSAALFSDEDSLSITDAGDSGYWTTRSNDLLVKGREFWVPSSDESLLARLVVFDTFTYADGDDRVKVVELVPVWSKRPIIGGMPLERSHTISTRMQFPVSLERLGFELSSDIAISKSLIKLTGKLGIDRQLSEANYELTASLGMVRRVSLGFFANRRGSLGSWWTNLQLSTGMHLQGGVLLQNSGNHRFLYGGEVYIELGHQSSARFYWGMAIAYRYRAYIEHQQAISMQSNERGITLSPTIGWVW